MAVCDTRQLSEAQRVDGYDNQRTGVRQAVRPFSGAPTPDNLVDYLNREVYPALKATRDKINDVYLPVTDNAPSANPLAYYFATETANADPTAGRLRLNASPQETATIIRVSQSNARLVDVAAWLDVMAGSATVPLGTVTVFDVKDPRRFLRFDLGTMVDQGAYWDLGVVLLESSHDDPFVADGPVVLAFIPGVAGSGTGATVPGTHVSGALGPRQFLSSTTGTAVDFHSLSSIFPGAPIYDVMAYPFNASGSLAGDDTAAINAAIAAANAAPGVIFLGPAHRITAALTAITGNNIRLVGRGEFNGGTILQVDSAAAVDAVTISGCQYSSVERVWIVGTRVFASGFGIRFVGTFRCFTDRVVITSMCFGVEHLNCTLSEVRRTHLGDLYGIYGFLARGSGGSFNHAVRYEACVCGTDYPAAVVGVGRVWATSTAYVVGNIVFANNNIYQAVQSGTSSGAGSGPSGSGATVASAHTTQITDGTVKWVFAMSLTIWFCQESGSQTFEVVDCGTLQGGYGLLVADSAGSVPLFCRVQNLQVDHPFTAGIQLDAGGAIRMNQVLVTSVQEGSGIVIGSGVSGNWEFVGGEVFGCNKAGITVGKGDGVLEGIQIGACGGISSNTRDCIEVAAGVTRFRITGCSGGAMFGATSPSTRFGLSIGAGADHYAVVGNVFSGNLTAGILNTPGRASTRALLDNDPDTTISPGSVWGLQVDGSTGVPIEITGLEVGELIRRENFVLETRTGTVTTLAIANTTTQIVCKSTGALVIRGMTATAATFGKTIEFSMHAGFAGTVTFNNEDASAASALERIACPEDTNLVLTAGQVALFTYFDSRWRCASPSRAGIGLTDGDKGDVTVSSSGTVWTIDTNVVSNAKIRQSVGLSVIGRASNTTGDVADIVAAGANRFLQTNSAGTAIGWDIISYGDLAPISHNRFIGNISGVTASPTSTDFFGLASDAAGGIGWNATTSHFELFNIVESRLIGRAEGAGTGTPGPLTPTQIVSIIDGESPTWTASHRFDSFVQFGTSTALPAAGDIRKAATLVIESGSDVDLNAVDDVRLTAVDDVVLSAGNDVQLLAQGVVLVAGTTVTSAGQIKIYEGASSAVNAAGEGQIRVDSVTPNRLTFIDDENVEWPLNVHGVPATIDNNSLTNSVVLLVGAVFTAPADTWRNHTKYHFWGKLMATRGGTATPAFVSVRCGVQGGALASADLPVLSTVNGTVHIYQVEGVMDCVSPGGAGVGSVFVNVVGIGGINGQAASLGASASAAGQSIDTTIDNAIELHAQFSAAVANLSLQWLQCHITRIA